MPSRNRAFAADVLFAYRARLHAARSRTNPKNGNGGRFWYQRGIIYIRGRSRATRGQKSAAAAHFGINAALEALREKPQREGDGELGASTCSEAFDGAPAARAGADEKPAIGPLAAGRAIRAGRNTPLSRLLRAYASAQKSPAVSNAAPIFTPREGDGRVAQTIRPSSREASFIAAPEGTFLPAEASFRSTFCKRG